MYASSQAMPFARSAGRSPVRFSSTFFLFIFSWSVGAQKYIYRPPETLLLTHHVRADGIAVACPPCLRMVRCKQEFATSWSVGWLGGQLGQRAHCIAAVRQARLGYQCRGLPDLPRPPIAARRAIDFLNRVVPRISSSVTFPIL